MAASTLGTVRRSLHVRDDGVVRSQKQHHPMRCMQSATAPTAHVLLSQSLLVRGQPVGAVLEDPGVVVHHDADGLPQHAEGGPEDEVAHNGAIALLPQMRGCAHQRDLHRVTSPVSSPASSPDVMVTDERTACVTCMVMVHAPPWVSGAR